MKISNRFYLIIKQIHLYASLSTVALLIMYLVTSYMMIYHDFFKPHASELPLQVIAVSPAEIAEANWPAFLSDHKIKGRLIRENFTSSGDLIREYEGAGRRYKLTILKDQNAVEILPTRQNLSGSIIGLHRLRGYGGPLIYNLYAFLLDLMGISLITFAITGVILWLKLLQHNRLAWAILLLGLAYVSAVLGYLLMV